MGEFDNNGPMFSWPTMLNCLTSRFFLTGIALALFIWILDPFIDAVFLHQGSVQHLLFHPDTHEAFMRSIISTIIVIMSFIGSCLLNRSRQAEDSTQEALSLLEAMLESAEYGILITSSYGVAIRTNSHFVQMWGIPDEIICSKEEKAMLEHVKEQLANPEQFIQSVERLHAGTEAEVFDTLEFKDGRVFERSSRPIFIDDKQEARLWSFLDITERIRADALKIGQQNILELISRGDMPLADIFEAIINFTEDQFTDVRATILYVTDNKLQDGVAPSMPASYLEQIKGLEIGSSAGSCGTAAYNGERVIVADVTSDPLWVDYRHLGTKYGFRACWSQPIFDISDSVFGTFALYREQPGVPDDHEIQLIETMSKLVSIAIKRRQAEEALRDEQQLIKAVINVPTDLIYVKDSDGRLILANPALAEYFGQSVQAIIGKTNFDLYSNEAQAKRIALEDREILATGKSITFERSEKIQGASRSRLTTKSPYRNSDGKIIGVIGISRDITEHKRVENMIRESEERFRGIFDQSTIPIVLLGLNGQILEANEACSHVMGYTSEEVLALGWEGMLHPHDLHDAKARLGDLFAGKVGNYQAETRYIGKSGGTITISATLATIRGEDGVAKYFIAILQDITERKQVEEELHKLSRAVEASSSIVMITNIEGNIEYVNPKFSEVTGYTKEEVFGKNPRFLHSGETTEETYVDLWETITSGGEWKGELHNRKKDGSLYWNRISISGVKDASGNITHFIGIQDDVTHEYKLTEQLSYQASHDALTGLVNRGEFERRAERLLATIRQDQDEQHALCYMDLDQFKVINDTCGHIAGDELLRQLGAVLRHEVRQRDTLARLGGDEFGILMEHCSLEQAQRVAGSLQKAVRGYQFTWEGQSFRVGVSMGLVAITEAVPNLSELMKQADAACYMAKDLGRNRIHVYHPEDSELAQRHGEMQWVTRLYQALEEDRFCLYAQTIVPLDGRSDKHYELLIRMLDEQDELIPPGAFLPAAERYDLITQLDRWVIEKAFTLLAENPVFQAQVNFISINLSGQSLMTSEVLDFIITQLELCGIAAGKICFEITETAAIANLSTARQLISTLSGLGCRFALDDFGSGLSSFAYLKNLPVDYLKIDGMFVKGIVDDPIDHAMVKSINEIGQVMGMQTIAEFVENDVIKDMLTELGVNYAQGYGIGKPMAFDELLGSSIHNSAINNPEHDEVES